MKVALFVEDPIVLEDVGWWDDGVPDVVDAGDVEQPHLVLCFLRRSGARSLSLALMSADDVVRGACSRTLQV